MAKYKVSGPSSGGKWIGTSCTQCGKYIRENNCYTIQEVILLSEQGIGAGGFCSSGCANAYIRENLGGGGSSGGGSSGSGGGSSFGKAAVGGAAAGAGIFAGLMALKGIGWLFKGLFLFYKYFFIYMWKYYILMFPRSVKWLLGKDMDGDDDIKRIIKRVGGAAFLLFHVYAIVTSGIRSHQNKAYAVSGIYDVEAITQEYVDKDLVRHIPVDSVEFSGGFFNYFKPVQNNNARLVSDIKTGKVTMLLEVQASEEFEKLKNEQIEKVAEKKDWKVGECSLDASYSGNHFDVIGDGMRYSGNTSDARKAFDLCLKLKDGEKSWIAVSFEDDSQKRSKAAGKKLLENIADLSDIEIEVKCDVSVKRHDGSSSETGESFILE